MKIFSFSPVLFVLLLCSVILGVLRIFKTEIRTMLLTDEVTPNTAEAILGIYDPDSSQLNENVTSLEHYTFRWADKDLQSLEQDLNPILKGEQDVLLTIEMNELANSKHDGAEVLDAILSGVYDDKLKKLGALAAKSERQIYVRWNPEMEVPVSLFTWQNQAPQAYIKAFRHLSGILKKHAPNLKIVLAPAGYPGALEYWPGADAVDLASITLQSRSELLSTSYPPDSSDVASVRRKLHRLRFIQKPVLILSSEYQNKATLKSEDLKQVVAEIDDFKKTFATATIPETAFHANENSHRKFTSENTLGSDLIIGVYDPRQELVHQDPVSVEHVFTDLPTLDNGSFKKEFDAAIARGHAVIVTVEPTHRKDCKLDKNVLAHTLNGHYDTALKELYSILTAANQTVYLRWAHEMEIPIRRYAWQSQDPMEYIKAYRYVAAFNKEPAQNIKRIWGPAGDRGSLEYWPGDDVVDYISIAIYGLPDKNITDHNQQESFSTIFDRKVYRMRFVDKPLFITEFGVKGPEDFKRKWLLDAAEIITKNERVVGICYFNLHDSPKAWGDIAPPDWSISPQTFNAFTKSLSFAPKNRIAKE